MLINTEYFQESARNFLKEGTYCGYPKGSLSYINFWKEENKRCIEGHKVGDLWIPGTYYFYLNYTRMPVKNEKTGNRKIENFPKFVDVDLEYFLNIEKARKEEKGFIMVKPRRTGFSQKNAGLISHEYNFYRDSVSVIGSFDAKYSSNTFSMVLKNLNFLDSFTEWAKERNPDTSDFIKARYRKRNSAGKEIWAGKMSEVKSLTFRDNPFASIGLSSNIFLFEEAGKFPNIIQSYNISEPCWKDGDDVIGTPILYGTGGDMEGGTVEFASMFYEPEKYNLLAFPNIYDDEGSNRTCGWFLPASKMRFGKYKDVSKKYPNRNGEEMVDNNGNSIIDLATQSIIDFRRLKEKGDDKQALRDAITQYPLKPKEAFLQSSSVYFPIRELSEVLTKINTSEELAKHYVGKLIFKDDELKWEDVQNGEPYRQYPVRQIVSGMIEIFEQPRKDINKIDKNRYIGGIDHYSKDISTTDSLGSIIIFDRLTRRIVAEYTGRPDNMSEFYETCRRLLIYYDARAMYESNFTNLFTYFESKKSVYLLEDTPKNLRDMSVWREGSNTSKGITASVQINQKGRELIKMWLLEPISEASENLTLEFIRSVGLLRELIHFNPDPKLKYNYDRISAMSMVMLYDATLTEYKSKEDKREKIDKRQLRNYFDRFTIRQKTFDIIKNESGV